MGNGASLHRFNEIFKILKNSGLASGVTPEKLCNTLEQLGPTFIKIGQILSTRVDLISVEYCDALSRLRSNVAPLPYSDIEKILREQYEDLNKIFYSIDTEPIGSGSIAQVHRAVLLENNKKVVIKVKRPGIESVIYTDIQLFKKAVNLLHLNRIIKVMDLNEVLDQVYETTKEELNFKIETSHLVKFRKLHEANKVINCPYVYEHLCSDNIIVMEYIDGIKVNDVELLKSKKYKLDLMADIISSNYIKQATMFGFFHADPHPDNIIISGSKIVYIDFGMMGRLTEKNKDLLKKCIKSIIFKDYKEVSRILVNMSTKLDEVDYENLSNDVAKILEEFGDLELESISTSKFISDMFRMLRNNNLVLDKDVTMLIRGIGIIEPVLKKLNPKISLFTVLLNSEEEKFENLLDIDKMKQKSKQIMRSAYDIATIPNEISSLLRSLNNGDAKFKVEMSDSARHVDKLENLVHELILGFVDGCLIIATVVAKEELLKKFFFVGVIVITLWLIIKMIMDLMHRGY